jgi:NitT/TauT family transport system ATP-binding protein
MSDTTTPSETIGMGRVLEHTRAPDEVRLPHVVEFTDVTKAYNVGKSNEFTAIRDVSFAVEDLKNKGEFICVLGPSGCGKSTILRLIAGLEPQFPATSGQVLVLGEPVIGPGSDRGMVFQDYTSFDHRTVLENITFGLECMGVGRKQRNELGLAWLEHVGLNPATDADKFPHELSGGMRQRVAIARTLILRPRIILMDEPFGALDPQTRSNMQDLLIKLWREVEATVFFVTHSIEEAVFLGDRIYVMSGAPGMLVKEVRVEPPALPAAEIHRDARFQETVGYLRDLITQLDTERRGKRPP